MDLKKVATLGAGAFGQVFLVKHDSQYYALKCLSKAHVIETGLQVSVCSFRPQIMPGLVTSTAIFPSPHSPCMLCNASVQWCTGRHSTAKLGWCTSAPIAGHIWPCSGAVHCACHKLWS